MTDKERLLELLLRERSNQRHIYLGVATASRAAAGDGVARDIGRGAGCVESAGAGGWLGLGPG